MNNKRYSDVRLSALAYTYSVKNRLTVLVW